MLRYFKYMKSTIRALINPRGWCFIWWSFLSSVDKTFGVTFVQSSVGKVFSPIVTFCGVMTNLGEGGSCDVAVLEENRHVGWRQFVSNRGRSVTLIVHSFSITILKKIRFGNFLSLRSDLLELNKFRKKFCLFFKNLGTFLITWFPSY